MRDVSTRGAAFTIVAALAALVGVFYLVSLLQA
jgi:hypothetical protein